MSTRVSFGPAKTRSATSSSKPNQPVVTTASRPFGLGRTRQPSSVISSSASASTSAGEAWV